MLKYVIPIGFLIGAIFVHSVESCNESICGSIVSKCLLTESCICDFKNCTCCRECFNCLGSLFTECCSCLDMCPIVIDTGSVLNRKSYVEDFNEGVPALFSVLTDFPDVMQRWQTISFPVNMERTFNLPNKGINFQIYVKSSEQDIMVPNCTVAFWSPCMSLTKCRTSCKSMGATSYRWFHDGCCECIGEYCINYGINESRCSECSQGKDISGEKEVLDEEDYDYGENDEYLDDWDD